MKVLLYHFVILLLWIVALAGSQTGRAQSFADGAAACQHTRLNYFGSLAGRNALRNSSQARIQYPGDAAIDVTYYKLDLNITYSPNYLRGAVTVGLKSTSDNLGQFFLDLANSLTVDSVKAGTQKLTFSQQNNQLTITSAQALRNGQSLSVVVYYQGIPGVGGNGTFVFGTHGPNAEPVIWSLSEPYGARDWFPCKDNPADKADSSEVWITAPRQFVSVSNGRLERTIDYPDGTRTYRWKNQYPIANYLISVAMSNYTLYTQTYRSAAGDSMPVTHYLYPESLTSSLRQTLDQTTRMLDVFSQYFGPYPFLKEKYGHAQFGWGGGMEHQTISSMGAFGTGIISHELAHQWFGDKITCRTWEHIWLNEGFATYAEALYLEAVSGTTAYRSYMNSIFSAARLARGTLFVQDISKSDNIFNANRTYYKGASVLHMLRGVVGDATFKRILQTYAASPFAYGTATTEDFAAIASQVYGQSLDSFFKQWIYGEGFPIYQATWSSLGGAGNQYRLQVRLQQSGSTASAPVFTMPVQLRVRTSAGDTLLTVVNNQADQVFALTVSGQPTGVEIDPNNWILKQVTSVQVVTDLPAPVVETGLTVAPNPARGNLTVQVDGATPFAGRLTLLNLHGQEVARLPEQSFTTGRTLVTWPVAQLPAGTYWVVLTTDRRRLTRTVLISN